MSTKTASDKIAIIKEYIKKVVDDSGAEGVIIGLSGGLDSALVARLAVDALGSEIVHTVYMPSKISPQDDERATKSLSSLYGTIHEVIEIDSIVAATMETLEVVGDHLATGNIMARVRMMILYHLAKKRQLLVLGTTNRSEVMMGYFTKYGDGGCDALPIGTLYNTEVREVSKEMEIPEEFLLRAPSAGLWEGQTDEAEMGIEYEDLDRILNAFGAELCENDIMSQTGYTLQKVKMVLDRVKLNEHKRAFPSTPDF